MDKSNIVNVQLQEYQPVSSVERVDRGGWVAFGVNNLFPQYLRELSESSPVHGSLCISIGDMIAGKGITTNVGQDRIDALDVYGQYYAASHDFKKYGGYFVEVIYSNDRKSIAKLRHLPFEECRIAVEGEDEDVIGIYHSEDWANTRKKKNRPTFIPKFNPSMAVNEPSQVLWKFNYTSGQIYPNPDYWSAVNYIELERQIGMYHVNNIMNGLFPSFIISFFNGQIPPDQQWDMKKDWERLLTGARNAGKFLMTFNERETPKPDITSFPLSDADKQYQFLSEESTNKVMIAHRITTPLIFGIRTATGFGSNKDEMATGLEIFINQVIEPAQRLIIEGFTEILSFELQGIELTVIPNTPLTEQVQVDTTTGAPTDVAATALNGAQITSLVDIAMQAAAGAIPVTSAKAIVSAAFPTLSQEQVDAIFNSIVPGSLNPTEVIQSQEKKKTCCVSESELSDEDGIAIADELIALGHDADEDWFLLDEFEVDYETDDFENAELEAAIAHELATSTGTARPNSKSEQDKTIDGKKFYVRYRYDGEIKANSRPFCKKMIDADKLYRKEDIINMKNSAVNPGWGPNGTDKYSVWEFKGGGLCGHRWNKLLFISAKGFGLDLNNPNVKDKAWSEAEKAGLKIRNNWRVDREPRDMPYKGFLPDNPVWGANGSAYK